MFLFVVLIANCQAEDGYRLWLRYDRITTNNLLQQYKSQIQSVQFIGSGSTTEAAKLELMNGLEGLIGKVAESKSIGNASVIVFLKKDSRGISIPSKINYDQLGNEGFAIAASNNSQRQLFITANTEVGILYGVFHFLRLIQTQKSLQNLFIVSVPKIQNRILNHWDNLNRHVERGYAGISIWNWHTLPGYIDQRYIDYARANASIGINGAALTNVNANARVLTGEYLEKLQLYQVC